MIARATARVARTIPSCPCYASTCIVRVYLSPLAIALVALEVKLYSWEPGSMTTGPPDHPPGRFPRVGCAHGSDPDTRAARHQPRAPGHLHGSARTPLAGRPASGRRP